MVLGTGTHILTGLLFSGLYWVQYDHYVSHWPRFGKWRILVTICDSQIASKQKASYDIRIDTTIMKDITDTVNDVCMVRQCNVLSDAVTVAMLPNGLQLHPHCVPYGRLLFVWDITIMSALLHVPYKSELIIT